MCAPRVTRHASIRFQGTDQCSSAEYRYTHVDVCVWQELEYRIDVWRVTRGAHIERR
jgi:hypothetical protein